MAERRMFAKSIVTSDAFLDMPMSARLLYFTLGMFADDDGFVNSPKSIIRQIGASQDDLSVLIAKRYVLSFPSGVVVIKHWRINNYLQSDRHKPTTYIEELNTLTLDEKGSYTEKTQCIQNGYIPYTQDSIGKNSIGKNNKEKSVEKKGTTTLNDFLSEYNISMDNYSERINEMDFDALKKAYSESKWLQTNIISLSKICKEYERIVGGYYRDYTKPNAFENSHHYSKEQLNSLVDNIDDIEFN